MLQTEVDQNYKINKWIFFLFVFAFIPLLFSCLSWWIGWRRQFQGIEPKTPTCKTSTLPLSHTPCLLVFAFRPQPIVLRNHSRWAQKTTCGFRINLRYKCGRQVLLLIFFLLLLTFYSTPQNQRFFLKKARFNKILSGDLI